MKCPICGKPVAEGDGGFPFCGERCRTLDLGNWAAERYVISTPCEPKEAEVAGDADGD